MFTDQERLQRKREMARLRQARKRARDRERQSMGRESLGSGMELDSGDIPEGGGVGSESGDHSTLNQEGTDDELEQDDELAKGLEMIAPERQNGSSSAGENQMVGIRGGSRGKGVEIAPQPSVISGIGPMQLHPDHEMQGIATRSETPTQAALNIHPHERIPVVYDRPRISGEIVAEDEDGDDAGDNHAIIWPWLRRTVRLIESSRGDRKMQEEIYTVLYSEEMAKMLEWEDSRGDRLSRQQSELNERVPTPELGARNSTQPGFLHGLPEEDKESSDEIVDELLGRLEERVQAIKKQKGLKAEVQSLRRDLIDKEAQLKEYNAIVDMERAAWQAEKAERSESGR